MPDPVIEDIVEALAARIALVTTGNGYDVSVSEVTRVTRNSSERKRPNQVWIALGAAESLSGEEGTIAGNPIGLAWIQEVVVGALLMPSKASTVPLDRLGNIFISEIMRGIASSSSWHSFGGLALDSDFAGIDREIDNDNGEYWVMLRMLIKYRTNETDPRTNRP